MLQILIRGSGSSFGIVCVELRAPSHGQVEGDMPVLGQLEPNELYRCARALLDPSPEWRHGWQGAAEVC